MSLTAFIVPHSHYDAAWQQTYEGYLQLNHRHILEVLKALREIPDFKFVFDQTALLEPFLERYPEQAELFREMVRAGRIELVCGMYVMPDVNLPNGESLIRQAQVGQAFLEREFGVTASVGYMLDVFGNHNQMPQIMRGLGFDSYIFGRVRPADSPSDFLWEGLDGTTLRAYWMPYHYVLFWPAPANALEFEQFAQERLARLRPHALPGQMLAFNGMDFVPPQPHVVAMARQFNATHPDLQLRIATVSEYLEATRGIELPTVTGEMNAVFQGCYTSRIRLKQENRRLEQGLEAADRWNAVAGIEGLDLSGHTAALEAAWRKVLFNQFHDVICGCHADVVYQEALEGYADAGALMDARLKVALDYLADRVDVAGPEPSPEQTSGSPLALVVFNSLPWDRTDVARVRVSVTEPGVADLHLRDPDGAVVPLQLEAVERYSDGGIKQADLLFIADVPALGYAVYRVGYGRAEVPTTALACSGDVRYGIQHQAHEATIENEFYRLTLDNWGGQIRSLWHKQMEWEVIDPQRPWGNVLTKEPDHGDLWEINGPCKGGATTPTHRPFPFPEPWAADFSDRYGGNGTSIPGPVCVQHRLPGPFGAGWRETVVRLYHRLPRIEFETHLVNRDEWVRYRVAFPTVLRCSTVVHEIPFGAVERPAGEFPAQNWIDLSDGQRGVALLNQGLPGNNADAGILMLSLLRAVRNPGMDSDGGFEKGVPHVFRYALLPHAGTYRQAHIYRAGLEFNHPFQVRKVVCRERTPDRSERPLPLRHSFVRVRPENVLLSALKPTEQGWVVRVYEAAGGRRTSAAVAFPRPLTRAEPLDLRERREKGRVFVEGNELRFHLKPFQVRTFRVAF